ncbi:MAG: glycolate oxidase subunit GlcD, partial [Acidobacteriota bacterium]|nr:glycolate oxidase subunit GlcD [Acidobacteriota bacterium]
MPIGSDARAALSAVVGSGWTRDDEDARLRYGTDALQQGVAADLVLIPGSVEEIAAIARLCNTHRVPLVVRGA